MWVIFLVTLINTIVGKSFAADNRLPGGIQIFDPGWAVAVLAAIFLGGRIAGRDQPTHPLYRWSMIFLWIAWISGMASAALNGFLTDPVLFQRVISHSREFIMLPLTIFIGYRLTKDRRSLTALPYIIVIGGLLTAMMQLKNFANGAEQFEVSDNINFIRSIDWPTIYANVAAALLIYCVVAGLKLLPTIPGLLLGCLIGVGYLSNMHRAEWLITAAVAVSFFFILPPEKRLVSLGKATIVTPIVLAALLLSIHLVSVATGRDFLTKVQTRVVSMLPSSNNDSSRDEKAWSARLSALPLEFDIYMTNPLLGGGFGAHEYRMVYKGEFNYGANHNGWMSQLCKAGPFALIGSLMVPIGLVVVSYRMIRTVGDDRILRIMATMGWITGVFMCIAVLTSYIWTSRAEFLIGVVFGALLRAREIQFAEARDAVSYEGLTSFDAGYSGPEFSGSASSPWRGPDALAVR